MSKFIKINEHSTISYKNKFIKTPMVIPIKTELELQEIRAELRFRGIFDFEILENTAIKIERIVEKPVQKIISTIPVRPSKLIKMNKNKKGD